MVVVCRKSWKELVDWLWVVESRSRQEASAGASLEAGTKQVKFNLGVDKSREARQPTVTPRRLACISATVAYYRVADFVRNCGPSFSPHSLVLPNSVISSSPHFISALSLLRLVEGHSYFRSLRAFPIRLAHAQRRRPVIT